MTARSVQPSTIRTDLSAIFVSLELSRSTWLITSLSPGSSEKISKHSISAGDVSGLFSLFSKLRERSRARTGQAYPTVAIQEAGLDGFWIHRVLEKEAIESHVVDRDVAQVPTSKDRSYRWGGVVANPDGIQARRAARVLHGASSFA